MLITPLGPIQIIVNNQIVDYSYTKLPNLDHFCPDVNGRYSIQVKEIDCISDIKCVLSSDSLDGDIASGERYESISFYKEDIKLTIGIAAEFLEQQPGMYIQNGIQITSNSPVLFCICWIQPCTKENDIQTYFGADPFFIKK